MTEKDQAQITVLKFPDNVRLRKEMYLIDPNHCIYEILDNAVDEYSAGRCTTINVVINAENKNEFPIVSVSDNGGGIPTIPCKDPDYEGHSQAYVALGALTTSGKYGAAGKNGYTTITSGLHGVGASCVNAVSEFFKAVIKHNGFVSYLSFSKGICEEENIEAKKCSADESGTMIQFKLDKTLWKNEEFDFDIIYRRLKQLSYLNPGLTFNFELRSENNNIKEEIRHPDGLVEYFKNITKTKKMLTDSFVRITKVISDPDVGNISIDTVFNYNTGYSSDIYGFVNNVSTKSGDHISGFNAGIVKCISHYLNENKDKYKTLIKSVTNDDFKEGLIAILSVKVMNPKFEGQSKSSIKMREIWNAVNMLVCDGFKLYLEQNPSFVKVFIDKIEKAAKARIAAKRAREAVRKAKSTLDSSLPGKLAACSNKSPEKSEIFLVEGDSAAGSAIQARDSKIQAILPVFGKILNTEKSREDEVLNNLKLLDVIKALKCGIGSTFDVDKVRYHKIIIMADADVDGAHITNLWITFFYRFMPEIIEKGYLYVAVSPIYRVTSKISKKEEYYYLYNDEELEAYSKNHSDFHVSYIKGLGELQPQQLWESTMDPENRHIIKIDAKDEETASETIELCMGNEVAPRKDFILKYADFSKVV